jgi:hypothetical protein
MKPNVNNVSNGTVGAGPGPVGTEQVVAEQVAVAQVEPAAAGSVVAEPEKSKKGHGMLIGLILCLLLAAGGIGFGVWEMMDGNTQKDNLNKQITDLKAQVNDLKDKLASASDSNGGDAPVDSNTGNNVDTADYIYIGEWGIKIKIPEGLDVDSYAFDTESEPESTRVSVKLVEGEYGNYYLGVVVRVPKAVYEADSERLYESTFSDDKYYYIVSGPNGGVPVDLENATNLVKTMLSTQENYSAI